jgi:RNA-binding protein YlmH
MKKSEIYRAAQAAVIRSDFLCGIKLEILRELIDKEDVALFVEEREEKEKADATL